MSAKTPIENTNGLQSVAVLMPRSTWTRLVGYAANYGGRKVRDMATTDPGLARLFVGVFRSGEDDKPATALDALTSQPLSAKLNNQGRTYGPDIVARVTVERPLRFAALRRLVGARTTEVVCRFDLPASAPVQFVGSVAIASAPTAGEMQS